MQTILDLITSGCGLRNADRPEQAINTQRDQQSEWIDHENGNWTFTGFTLDNIPDDLRGRIQFVSAPIATRVKLPDCSELKSLEAPNATTVTLCYCRELEILKVPNATTVDLRDCRELERFEAPKATEIALYDCDQHSPDRIIQQLKNPQKLHYFKVNSFTGNIKDITQDIKNADMELNGSEYVKKQNNEAQFDTFIGATQRGNRFAKALLGTMDNRHPEKGAEMFGTIIDYAGLKHENLAALNSKALLGYIENQRFADEKIEDYKKQHIVPKTHAHTDMKNAKTTGRVRSDVRVGFGY